ncbi:MAG: mannitol dehydrogenase family protein [Cellulomonas sp.]
MPRTGIVHIGLGNFHRAHLAVYTAKAVAARGGEWGIFAYSLRGQVIPKAMVEQDLLYSVVDIAPGTDAVAVPAIHTAALGGEAHSDLAVAEIARASTKIVTLTVTEAGYTVSPRTNGLDIDLPAVRSDLSGRTSPTTAIGLVARGLQERVRMHGDPVTVLSCDNLSHNGDRTGALVRQFAASLPPGEREDLMAYIESSVTFPNSMVDRIVPGVEARHHQMVADRLGVWDQVPVPAEPFTMWVLEDTFAGGRPAWEVAGAIFTDDVASFELMKLRLLNGTHSLLAYLGALDGRKTIPESRSSDFIERAARILLFDEYLPTLTVPRATDPVDYIEQLFARWSNTVLADRTSRVGSDGSVKLPQRITEPAQYHLARGRMPEHICLTVAAYLACLAPPTGFDPGPQASAMVDPAKEQLSALAALAQTPGDLVRAVFDRGQIFAPVLAELPGFVERIADYLTLIVESGIRAAAFEAARASNYG